MVSVEAEYCSRKSKTIFSKTKTFRRGGGGGRGKKDGEKEEEEEKKITWGNIVNPLFS